MRIQQYKSVVVTSGLCMSCQRPFDRKFQGRAITILTQKRRRYIGQRFCMDHLPPDRQLKNLMKPISAARRKERIQRAREAAQAVGMRRADLLDYCNRCGFKGGNCTCPGGPYFP